MASRRRRRRGRTQKWEEECGDGDGPSSHRSAAPAAISLSHFRLPPAAASAVARRRRDAQTIRGEEEEVSHIIPLQRGERREREGGSQSASMSA